MKREKGRRGAGAQRPVLEVLEERIAPAGVVSVEVVGGTLVITGDADGNYITISQEGLGANEYRVEGLDGTGVGIGTEVTATDVTKGIKIAMGDGSDTVEIDTVSIAGPLVFDGGDGNNTLAATAAAINGSVSVKAGDGLDTISIAGTIAGKVTIAVGDGGANVVMDAATTGKVSFKSGLGDDLFTLADTAAGLDINMGAGNAGIEVTAAVTGGITVKAGDGTLTATLADASAGKVAISHGAGDSTITVTNFTIDGGLSVANKAGADALSLDSVMIGGAVKATNGDGGSDTALGQVRIIKGFALTNGDGTNDTTANEVEIRGAVAIKNGDGNSSTSFTDAYLGMDQDHEKLAGTFKLTEGEGAHTISFDYADFAKSAKITTGGTADITMREGYLHGGGMIKTGGASDVVRIDYDSWTDAPFTIDTGAGDDQVYIDDSEFDGNFTVKTGDGADLLAIETLDTLDGWETDFDYKFSANMGAGNDEMIVGVNGSDENVVSFWDRVMVDGGAGEDDVLNVADTTYNEVEPVVEKGFETSNTP